MQSHRHLALPAPILKHIPSPVPSHPPRPCRNAPGSRRLCSLGWEGPPEAPAPVGPPPSQAWPWSLGSSQGCGWGSISAALSLAASMNVALYAGIAGGVLVVLILIGVLVYCCCCREESEDKDSRP